MCTTVATVGSPAGEVLYEYGLRLEMLGILALVLGSLRFLTARVTMSRWMLFGGMTALLVGMGVHFAEMHGMLGVEYYPGWRKDYAEDAWSPADIPVCAWWEPLTWWGQRVLRLAGLALGAGGFLLEARLMLREGTRRAG